MEKPKFWQLVIGAISVMFVLGVAGVFVLVFVGKVSSDHDDDGFSCYECAYMENVQISLPGKPTLSDDSCKDHETPNDNAIRECPRAIGIERFVCGKLTMKGLNYNQSMSTTVRMCMPYLEGTEDECKVGKLEELANTNDEWWYILQFYLRVYGINSSIPTTACKCTFDDCNSAFSSTVNSFLVTQIIGILLTMKFY